jgi:hypothetical protein
MLAALIQADQKQIKSVQDQIARDTDAANVARNKALLDNKQLENANAINLALKDLQVSLLTLLKGPLEVINPILRFFADHLASVSTGLLVLGGILMAYKAYALSQVAMGKDTGGAMARLFGEWGRSPAKALWVRVVPGGGSLGDAGTPGGAGGPDDKGKGGKMAGAKMLGKGVAGIAGGFALDYAAEKAQESGNTTTSGVLDTASSGLTGFGMGSMALGALALLGAPLTGGASLALLAAATGGGLLAGGIANKDKLFGSSPNLTTATAAAESKPTEESDKSVASYQQRTADNSDRMIMILRELRDISLEHKEIDKGTAPYVVNTESGLKWQRGRQAN